MAAEISNYKCPSCGAPLVYSIEKGRLLCEYCDSTFTIEEVNAFNAAQEAAVADVFENTVRGVSAGNEREDVWGENMREYSCPSCGAVMVCDSNTAAICCPYCGNTGVIPGQFSGMDKPDYVIPFKLNKEAAIAALKAHYKGKPFLPKSFTSENQIQKLQGVYIPFWLFDAQVEANCKFDGQKEDDDDDEKRRTRHYDSRRSGSVSFDRVPIDASARMDDDLMDSVLPYNYKDLKEFSTAYFAGFLAERYDVGVDECAKRVEDQCVSSIVNVLMADAKKKGRYDKVEVKEVNSRFRRTGLQYVMLPVWLLHTRWKDNDYIFAMNGQTGKMVGDVPVAMSKWWRCLLGLSAVFGIIWAIIMSII